LYCVGVGRPFDHSSVLPQKLKKMVKTGMLKFSRRNKKYYSNTEKLGEALLATVLEEVSELCHIYAMHNKASQLHQQVLISTYFIARLFIFFSHS